MPRPRCALMALCLVAACARHAAVRRPAAVPASVEVVLRVTNHHFVDITVSIERDGTRTRVGTVTAATSAEFVLPLRAFGVSREFRLVAEAIGSPEAVSTETLTIQPGQFIEWTLEHDLRRSSVGVF